MKEAKKFFSSGDIGIIGSYSSFLALLTIATILAFRHIFDYIIELLVKGTSASSIEAAFIVVIIFFGLIFIVLPSIPIITSIARAFRDRNRWLATTLIFIYCVYVFAIISQFIYTLLDKVIKV